MKCGQLSNCLKSIKPGNNDCPCKDKERYKKCIGYHDNRKIMVCEERNQKYALDKEGEDIESICYHVDGGVLDAEEHDQRCDYAFYLRDSDNRLILIELKGNDSAHALDQLSAMLDWDQIKEAVRTKTVRKLYGRIVCNRAVPSIYRNKQKTLQAKFIRSKGNLKIMNRKGEETYRELCTD